MLDVVKRALVSNPVTNRLLFNQVTGSMGEYIAAARRDSRYARYRTQYDIDPSFEFVGPGTLLEGSGRINLERDSYIGRYSRIRSKSGSSVRIGENTAVSYHVHIYTHNRVADQDMGTKRNRSDLLAAKRGDVTVGENCWIGAMTFVTEGCAIGDNTVVGANSVVTRDLPPYCIAAGCPARVKQFKSCVSEETMSELAEAYAEVLDTDLREMHLESPET